MTETQHSLTAYSRHLRAQGYSPNTVRAKCEVVAAMARFCDVEPDQLQPEHVEQYLARDLAAWTRRKYLEHLRAYARWSGMADPAQGLRSPRRPRAVPRPVSEQALAELLAAATPRTRAFVILGAFVGLRAFEIAKVRGADFETTADGPVLRITGKGGRLDVVPLPHVVVRELASWRATAGHGALWPGLTANAVQQRIKALGQTAGVPLTCHQLRHRYGTALYAASRDLLTVQRLMRHSSPTTTAGYALVLDQTGKRLVDLLPVPRLPAAS